MGQSYKDLKASQKSMQLVTDIYRLTRGFPREETYGLTSQLRRSAVSIPSNIAEGQGRRLQRDFQHFLRNARGSLLELETQIMIAGNLAYFGKDDVEKLLNQCAEVGRILNGLLAAIGRNES